MEKAFTRCSVRDTDAFRPLLAKLTGGLLDTMPMGPKEDAAYIETMVRDRPEIFVDKKAVAEMGILPVKHVPVVEKKAEPAQEQNEPSYW